MSIKKVCTLLMSVFYCILINSLYHISDLSVLYKGVNLENNIMLLLAQFLSFASITFYVFGEAEKYINGYGKYVLVRRKKRTAILNKIYAENFLAAIVFEIIKIVIYIVVSSMDKTDFSSFVIMLVLSILTNLLLISVQILIEILFNSKIALIVAMAYFIISCTVGGVIIKEKLYAPLLILIPNYSMSYRTEYFISELNLNYLSMNVILITVIIGFVFTGKMILKRKDIF